MPDAADQSLDHIRLSGVASSCPAISSGSRRLIALAMAAGSAAILGLAAGLTPSATGMGTHQQIGMPPCGWIVVADLPCPTCGMTTAFAHAADGHLIESFLAQPLGCLLAVATAMTLLVSLYVAITGSRLAHAIGGLWRARMGWVISALVLSAWGYKVAVHKGLL